VSPARLCALLLAALTIAATCLLGSLAPPRAGAVPGRAAHVSATAVHVTTAGVYELTVLIHTTGRRANLTVRIGSVVRRVRTTDHRAVIRLRLTVRGHDLRITARSRDAAPLISASWRMLDSLPAAGETGPTGPTGRTGATATTAPSGPPNQVAVGINVAATSGNLMGSSGALAAIDASAPAWVRVFIGWDGIEPQHGVYNSAELASYQQFFRALPAATKIAVDVEGTPAWAAGGSSSISTPPVANTDYAAFLSYLVDAFGGRVTAWEIWNEEDSAAWWNGTPAQYTALVQASYAAIKAADPQATVILGGLTGNDAPYLAQLYAAGAGGSFDAVGVHTDTACNITSPEVYQYNPGTRTINQYDFLGFTSVYATMAANGDAAKPIYVTELGWSTTSAVCQTGIWAGQKSGGVDQATQATYLEQAYHCLAAPQYPYVKVAIWFELADNGTSTAPVDNFGLLANDLSPKPAFAAFEQESLHGDQLTGPCG
jgi:polysaccharide biosynthesis protein PslG